MPATSTLASQKKLPVVVQLATRRSRQVLTTVVLTGVLSLGSSLSLFQSAIAATSFSNPPSLEPTFNTRGVLVSDDDDDDKKRRNNQPNNRRNHRENRRDNRNNRQEERREVRESGLPRPLANRVRLDLAGRTGLPPGQLRVVEATRRTWRNSCLELPSNGVCTQARIEGWRIVLANGNRTWVYRTDETGQIMRLEGRTVSDQNQNNNLPRSVADSVLQVAARDSGLPRSSLQIVRAEQRTWPNGCLGIAQPGVMCTQALVPGWRVVVQAGQQRLIYRTNNSGSVVRLDPESRPTSNTGGLQPISIPAYQLPPPLSSNIVFRVITTGGIAGQTYEATLRRDGQLIQGLVTNNGLANARVTRLSPQEVDQFLEVLRQQNFNQFDRLGYDPSAGADFRTITLSSRSSTTRYADSIQNQLPATLQRVIEAWRQLGGSI